MTASETAILIEDSDEDEIVVEEASGRSEAIVISDSEEEQEVKGVIDDEKSEKQQAPEHSEENPFFYIDLTTRNLKEVESTDIKISDNPKILSMANVAKKRNKSSSQKNRNPRKSKCIDKYLLKEALRVKALEQEELDAETDSDCDENASQRLWFYRDEEEEEDGGRPGKRVSRKQLKAKRRKKELAKEEKERNRSPKRESKKQARRRRQKERKLKEIPTVDLVGYEPTKEEIMRKKSLEEMKKLEKAEIARITEKRKRDMIEMRMKGIRRTGSKAVARRFIAGHLGMGGKGQSSRQRREDRYCQELREDKRKDNRRKKENSLRKLEEEGRAEGLSRKLEANNKGFAMLVKMGYNPGDCLGKDQQGRLEPVTIEMRWEATMFWNEPILSALDNHLK